MNEYNTTTDNKTLTRKSLDEINSELFDETTRDEIVEAIGQYERYLNNPENKKFTGMYQMIKESLPRAKEALAKIDVR